jgi:glycerol-3-phosphate dehydrogenase (NAD(P)+)
MTGPAAVIGGGSWGTALALQLARNGRDVRLWFHDPSLEKRVRRGRVNRTYLPGHRLPAAVQTTARLPVALEGATTVLVVVPSHHLRRVVRRCAPHLRRGAALLMASKGIENRTLLRMSQVAAEETGLPAARIASLSGPSFAREVALGHPTTVVIGARSAALARRLQEEMNGERFRVYRNADQVGVELGGALKNVVALAAGILDGLGYGSNTSAALLTRGLHEITRLAVALGGRRTTLAGLAGMGDLVLTCTGKLSRNRQVGVELGRGRSLREILADMKMVAEGVRTSRSARALSLRSGVEMPIVQQVHGILFRGRSPARAVQALLERELKSETSL